MSTVSQITGAIPTTTPTAGNNILGKDDFLKIFLAQLAHQDPTAPVDSQAFVAQLAQFSSLEAQKNTNTDLEALMMGQAAQQQTSVTALVGKDVLYKSTSFTLGANPSTTLQATLAQDAGNVSAVITDKNGKAVRTLQLGPSQAGAVAVAWDGRDDAGVALPAGSYAVAVTATDTSGASLAVDQGAQGHVTGVSFAGGATQLLLGSQKINLSDVIQINERTTP